MKVGQSTIWTPTEATVYSAEWIDPQGENRGCWQVSYSYRVGDDYFSGQFTDFSSEGASTYQKGEALGIEYLQESPAKSRVPGIQSFWQAAQFPMTIGACAGLAAIVIYYIVTHLH